MAVQDGLDGRGVGEPLKISKRVRGRGDERRGDVPGVRWFIIPPTRSETHDPAKMRFITVQVLLQRFGSNLHQHLHVNLRLFRIMRHPAHQLLIFERSTNPHLAWWGPDLAIQSPRNAEADALFANTVCTTDNEEAATGFGSGGERHGDAVVFGLGGCIDELGHSLTGSLSLDDFPGITFFSSLLFKRYAHVGAGFDDFFLRREGVAWIQVGGVEVADVNLLLFSLAGD